MTAFDLDLGIDDPLALSNAEVGSLTRPEREARLDALIGQARDFLSEGIAEHVTRDGRMVAAVGVMFSGGSDSTALAHLFRRDADLAVHANTTIGIEQTREFVRNTCEEWGLSLIERTSPREVDHYRNLVLTRQRGKKGQALGGFPGPAMHFKMFSRLKERVFEAVRNDLVSNPRKERVVYVAGRRRTESTRRRNVPVCERKGSTVWVSPLVNWTKLDLNTYRLRHGVPSCEASRIIHMSGECLCGAMASPGERDEIAYWFPGDFGQIAELERLLADRDDIPEHRKTWGWGADPAMKAAETAYLAQFGKAQDEEQLTLDSPFLCQSCDDRYQTALDLWEIA